jgi:hypothetical protein
MVLYFNKSLFQHGFFLWQSLIISKICGVKIASVCAFFVQLKLKKEVFYVFVINLTNEIECVILKVTLIKGLPHTLYLKELKPGDRPIIGLFYFKHLIFPLKSL